MFMHIHWLFLKGGLRAPGSPVAHKTAFQKNLQLSAFVCSRLHLVSQKYSQACSLREGAQVTERSPSRDNQTSPFPVTLLSGWQQ